MPSQEEEPAPDAGDRTKPTNPPKPPNPPAAPGSGSGSVEFVVEGPITRADIPVLCARARTLMEGADAALVVCDVRALGQQADAVVVDALARLQLAARRRGYRVALRHASIDLLGLLVLAGLSDIVPLEPGSG
ncbi:MAG TPA: hypothetical protein VFZ77_22655 [Acidimicrobiales bacterium]